MLKKYWPLLILLIFSIFLFFYKLGIPTLGSWDEAWYGAIAREIIKTGNVFNLKFNGAAYYSHPPLGFWMMALSYKLFGITELTTRLPSAIFGLFTVIFIYLTAILIFKRKVIAFVASLMMITSVWYVLRVRSGNLDAILTFFYIATIYFSLRSSKTIKWFPLATSCFGALMISKTLVGLSAILLMLLLNLRQILLFKKNWRWFLIGLVSFSIIVLPWYLIQIISSSSFLNYHFFEIGIRKKTLFSFFELMGFSKTFYYLHMGIRKWYYIWLFSIFFLISTLKFLEKKVFFLIFWLLIIIYPFLTSNKTELWHLIPLYLPIVLMTAGTMFDFFKLILKNEILTTMMYLIFFLLISFVQIKTFLPEVIQSRKYIDDEVDISYKLNKYNGRFFLVDQILPRVVFYSGKTNIINTEDKDIILNSFKDSKNNIYIMPNWVVENYQKEGIFLKTLEKNKTLSIVKQ